MRYLPTDSQMSLTCANEYFFLAENKLKDGEKYEFEYAGKKMLIEKQGEDFFMREAK